jgi:hypothetical protein
MLGSAILTSGRDLATLPSTSFYSDAEGYRAINNSWNDIYALLVKSDDDHFITDWSFVLSSMTPVTDRQYTYELALPSDMYRLRLLQYSADGNIWIPMEKFTLEQYGANANWPAYRIKGSEIIIIDQANSRMFQGWYYPPPQVIISSTDITYPLGVNPEFMSYQVAIEIRRKQQLDVTALQARRDEIFTSMKENLKRDEARAEQVKNTFDTRYLWW